MSIISRTVKSLNTLAVDTNVFSGMNKINRKISGNSTVEFGDFSAQRTVLLAPERSTVLDLVVYGIIVLTDQPIVMTMGLLSPITVKKLFVYYGEVSSIKFENVGTTEANISFSYVADPVPASALSLTFLHLGAGMSAGMPLTYSADTAVYPPLPAPVAMFRVSATGGAAPLGVVFTDDSMNNPTSWHWDFGDGNTSTAQNPSHVYAASGSFTVALTVANALGSNTLTQTELVVVTPTTVFVPVANFTAVTPSGEAPLDVAFTDTSTHTPTSWHWDFGDGTTSTSQNPTHTYNSVGPYDVALRATNSAGTGMVTKPAFVHILPPKPTADFGTTTNIGPIPLVVAFSDASANHPTSWLWDFGDGTTSTLQNPTHVYSVAGTYGITFTATNATGSTTVSYPTYIQATVPIPLPVANFTSNVTAGSIPLTVNFTDTSTNSPTEWLWDFGDGATSTVQSPVHTYALHGSYTVKLTVTNGGGTDAIAKTSLIAAHIPAPVASFSSTSGTGNTPLTVMFIDTSTNSPTQWLWNFGDGNTSVSQNPSHVYATSGTYTVSLTATNSTGSNQVVRTSLIHALVVAPVANFVANRTQGAMPLSVSFVDNSSNVPTSWLWNFGDGNTSTARNPSHTYATAGSYTVSLTATNSAGSNQSVQSAFITVTPQPVPAPVASFTGDVVTGIAPLTVNFTDTSTNSPTTWHWRFGDTKTSSHQNPSHTYAAPGLYNVSLTATNASGSTTITHNSFVNVEVPAPGANFLASVVSGTIPLAVTFTDTSAGTPSSWHWDFGDGTTSTAQHPTHTYTAVGTYTVALTATSAGGGNTITKTALITTTSSVVTAPFWSSLSYFPNPTQGAFFDGAAYGADQSVVAAGSTTTSTEYVNVIKWSASGAKLWDCKIGDSNGGNVGEYVVTDATGNNYVVSSNGNLQTLGIYKVNASGTLLWQKDLSGTNGLWPGASALMSDGFVSAYYYGSSFGSHYLGIVKLDFNGNIMWQVEFDLPGGAPPWTYSTSLAVDASDNIYMLTPPFLAAMGDGAVVKFSSTGTMLWAKSRSLEGLSSANYGSITCSTNGLVYFIYTNIVTEMDSSGAPIRVFSLDHMDGNSPITIVARGSTLFFSGTAIASVNHVVGAINLTAGTLSYVYHIDQGGSASSYWYNYTYSRMLAVSSDRMVVVGYPGAQNGAMLVNMPTAMGAHPTGMRTTANSLQVLPDTSVTLSLANASPAPMTNVALTMLSTGTTLVNTTLPSMLVTTDTYSAGILTDI